MKVYSPSKTEAYDTCSMKGDLMYKQHLQRREADNGTIGKIVGSAFAKGTEEIHTGRGPGIDEASALFDRTVDWYLSHGVSFDNRLSGVRDGLCESLVKYAKQNPFTKWQIKEVEFELYDYGRCRLDVLGVNDSANWCIADIKYKRSLNLEYLNKTVTDYLESWQFNHYPWAYNDWLRKYEEEQKNDKGFNRSIERYFPVTHMALILVIAKPFKVLPFTVAVNDAYQKRWYESAQQKWADIYAIENGDKKPCLAASHRDAYGYCPMRRACVDLDLDENLMMFEYTKVPRLPDEQPTKEVSSGQ